jgi:sialic acid synthase SpsE
MREIIIDGYAINENSKPYVIAEIGSNHDGDLAKCKRLIMAAKIAGCNAVKFQKKDVDILYTKAFYNSPYKGFADTYGEHKRFLEFSYGQFCEIVEYCELMEITWFVTPFDEESATRLNVYFRPPCYKIASSHLQDYPLLSHVVRYKKPLIISTGGASLEMISKAVMFLRIQKNFNDFALMHCVATYPNKDYQLNLASMNLLKEYGVPVGWSSHSTSRLSCIAAVVLGAKLIEIHIKERGDEKGTDKQFAVDVVKLCELVEDIERVSKMLGDRKVVLDEEKPNIEKMARSPWPIRTIKKGETLFYDNVDLKTPAKGLPAYRINDLMGKVAINELTTDRPIEEGDYE